MSSSSSLSPLSADLAALHALRARVAALTDQTRWETAVPLGPRAFVDGDIVHTNDVKVHLGAGWWVDVTARQASEIVGRKIQALESKIQRTRLQILEGLSAGVAPNAAPAPTPSLEQAGPAATPATAEASSSPGPPSTASTDVKTASAPAPVTLKPAAAAPADIEKAELVPLLLPSGQPQLAPEDNLPLYELRLAVDGLLESAPGGKGRLEPLPRATEEERERRKRERERIWAEAEAEERALDRSEPSDVGLDVEVIKTPGTATRTSTQPSAPSPEPSASSQPASKDRAKLQKALEALDLPSPPADGEPDGDVASNSLAELVDEDGRPISRIAIPASADDERKTPAPVPLPKPQALTPAQEAKRKAERDKLLDLLEAEEDDIAARRSSGGSGGVREVRRLPDLSTSPAGSDGDADVDEVAVAAPRPRKTDGKGKLPERRKSVQWSETDQVQEFDFREAIALASDPTLLPTAPPADDGPVPSLEEEKPAPKGPIVKDLVVERPLQPVVAPGQKKKSAPSAAAPSAVSAPPTPAQPKAPLVKEIAERPTPTAPPAPPVLEETTGESDDEYPTADFDDGDEDDDDGSYELSDLSDHSSDADDADGTGAGSTDLGLDMDSKLMMREAAVSYYRLKGALQSRGGLEGLLRGMGEAGGGDEPEFVPLDATLASDLDDVRLAPPEHQTADSRFHASNTAPSSIALPTLVPGGSATGVLRNAIRVGRLENGQLIVGGDESDEDEGADEGDEVEQAGKEALMWGMVGGVVVRPEDLAEEPGVDDQTAATPPPPPPLPQEAAVPPSTVKLSAKAGSSKMAPVVVPTSAPAAATKPPAPPPAAPKPILKTSTPAAVPVVTETPAAAVPPAAPTQLVGTPFERSTPFGAKAPSSHFTKTLDDPAAASPPKDATPRRMSKFRMRQQGLTDDV